MDAKIFFILILLPTFLFGSSLFNSYNKEGFDNFILESTKQWGSDEAFSKRYYFKYSHIYISQLRYIIINAHINQLRLEREEYFSKKLFNSISTIQFGYTLQFILLGIEVGLLIYILFLKLSKRKTIRSQSQACNGSESKC